jgi:3-hydroxyisobutyrate dehydrogenase-like beta-hydroxyacid dehydrogenase
MSQSVAFVGLGNMGSRMARRLVAAGHEVLGFDPSLSGQTGMVSTWAGDLSEVASADIILFSLPDAAVVASIMHGASGRTGLLAHLRTGHIVVDLTTSSPSLSRELNAAAHVKDAEFLDVGISGGAAGAEKGSLTLMVGGSITALESVRPLLDVLGSTVVHMGESGAGHATKILNNFLNAINLSASAEVLVAAQAAGLDVARVLDVINASTGANWATLNRFPHIIHGDYLEGGLTSKLMMKDIQLYLDYVAQVGVPSLHASGPVAAFGSAIQRGYGDEISNKVVDAIGDMSGGHRLHATPKPENNQPK